MTSLNHETLTQTKTLAGLVLAGSQSCSDSPLESKVAGVNIGKWHEHESRTEAVEVKRTRPQFLAIAKLCVNHL